MFWQMHCRDIKDLNMKAIEQIKPGGIIFTFSCSQVVTKENFRKSVFAAAANTGTKCQNSSSDESAT